MAEENAGHEEAGSKETRIRFNRHFFRGLMIGALAVAIIGTGIVLAVKPDLFSGSAEAESEAMLSGALLQTPQVVTPQDFDDVVLKSNQLETVVIVDTAERSRSLDALVEVIDLVWDGSDVRYYYATDAASEGYIRKLRVYTEEGPPILAMFDQGKLVAKKSLLTDAETLLIWMTRNRPAAPKPTSTTVPQPAPTPEPAAGPAVFRAFTTSMRDWFLPAAASEHYVSEVILTAVDYQIDRFLKADEAVTLPIASYGTLFALFGNRFGGDDAHFVMPGLAGQLPLAGLNYQIATVGIFPVQDAENPTGPHTVGDIKYLEVPVRSAYDLSSDLYVGEIILARDADGLLGSSSHLTPCDGREWQRGFNDALFAVLGNRFGGNGTTTFRVPDLTGRAPIEGAEYFIVTQGVFPIRRDGLPKP